MNIVHTDNNSEGATIVEMAIGLPVLLMFAILTVELARLAYVGAASQYILNWVVRDAILGPASFNSGLTTPLSQGEYISSQVASRAKKLGVSLLPTEIVICRESEGLTSGSNCSNTTSAERGEFFSVQIRTSIKLLFLGTYFSGGTVLARNENW